MDFAPSIPSFWRPPTMPSMPAMPAINTARIVESGANMTGTVARDLGLVARPVEAVAHGLPKVSPLTTAAKMIGRTLTVVVIGASVMQGADIVRRGGPAALVNTKEGRGALLGGVGGALVLCPMPVTQLGGAAALALAAANEFGWLSKLDKRVTAPAPDATTNAAVPVAVAGANLIA